MLFLYFEYGIGTPQVIHVHPQQVLLPTAYCKLQTIFYSATFLRIVRFSSLSCASLTSDGAFVSRQFAV